MIRNTNSLENIRCPDCGNSSRFKIVALITTNASHDGAVPHGDLEWDDDSNIDCLQCDLAGVVKNFRGKRPDTIRVTGIAYHRNGISGAPFHAALFYDTADESTQKIAVLFDQPHHCAVLDVTKLAQGNIAFGVNSYRGDRFEPALRNAIQDNA